MRGADGGEKMSSKVKIIAFVILAAIILIIGYFIIKLYSWPHQPTGTALARNPDGGVVVCGYYKKPGYDWYADIMLNWPGHQVRNYFFKCYVDHEPEFILSRHFYPRNLHIDSDGELYYGGVDWGPSYATSSFPVEMIPSSELSWDAYIEKNNRDSGIEWFHLFGGPGEDSIRAVTSIGSDIYALGYFVKSCDFGDDTQGYRIGRSSKGGYDIFICRLSDDGLLKDVVSWGGEENDFGMDIISDAENHFYVVGYFEDRVAMPEGAEGLEVVSKGDADCFLIKFDADMKVRWSRTWGGSGIDNCTSAAIGQNGDIYVCGYFSESISQTLGNTEVDVQAVGERDACCALFSPEGNLIWFTPWGGESNERSFAVDVTHDGSCYVTGSFSGSMIIDSPYVTETVRSEGGRDIFLIKLDSGGDIVWVNVLGDEQTDDDAKAVALDNDENIFITGTLSEKGFVSAFDADGEQIMFFDSFERAVAEIERSFAD